MKRGNLNPRKISELILINLNEASVENYKKNNKIDRVYEGTSDLSRYNEEASLAKDL